MWTILRTREYPPDNLEEFRKKRAESRKPAVFVKDIFNAIVQMPVTMRKLAWVQVFTWMGLLCMWLYFPVAVARNVFGAPGETSPLYQQGIEWAGLCFAMYSVVCFGFSFAIPKIARLLGRKYTHALCLSLGAAGLLSVGIIHNQYLLMISMTGIGIAWASILSMPYAMLAGAIPAEKTGVYMGVFNFFIVLPEILASLAFGWIMMHLLDNNRLLAVIAGGLSMIVAAVLVLRVKEDQ